MAFRTTMNLCLALALTAPATVLAAEQYGQQGGSDRGSQGSSQSPGGSQDQSSTRDRSQSQDQQSQAGEQNSERREVAKFDRQFMQKAAQGNYAEVQLSELAMEKASDPKVKELAQTLKNDHQQASQKLEQIAQQENVQLSQELPRDAEKAKRKLSNLSGEEFDREYTKFLLKEHKKDIREFERASERASHPEVQEFAKNTLPKLQQHLQMVEQIADNADSSRQSRQDRGQRTGDTSAQE